MSTEKKPEIVEQKEEIESIDKQQNDANKVSRIFTSPLLVRSLKYLTLTKSQKQIYKRMVQKTKNLDTPKKNFNRSNIFEVEHFNFWYDHRKKHALKDINMDIKRKKVTALIGPSGCGKSTFIRCLNRMNNQIDGTSSEGNIYFDKGINLNSKKLSTLELTTRVGMIFQKPSPFPMSIYDNVAYGPRSHGINDKKILDDIVEESLKGAAL